MKAHRAILLAALVGLCVVQVNSALAQSAPDEDWLRTGASGGRPLGGQVKTDGDARLIPINIDPAFMRPPIFSPDGKYLFTLQPGGLLQKVDLESLTEASRLAIARRCEDFQLSAAGLAVAVNAADEIWVVDPSDLKVKRKIPFKGVRNVVTCPAIKWGLAVGMFTHLATVIDLDTGKELGKASVTVPPAMSDWSKKITMWHFESGRMTPDGKWLLMTGAKWLARIQIKDTSLILDQVSPAQVGQSCGPVAVSPGGRRVAVYDDSTLKATVFETADLSKPRATLPFRTHLAMPDDADEFYGETGDAHLAVYNSAGVMLKEYPSIPVAGELGSGAYSFTGAVTIDPKGRGLLTSSGRTIMAGQNVLYWITFAKQGTPPTSTAPDIAGPGAGADPDLNAVHGEVSLAGGLRDINGLKVAEGSLDGKNVIGLTWSGDGNFLYILETTGKLRKVKVPEFVEKRSLDVGSACSAMAASSEGLVVLVSGRQEVCVIDPRSLKPKRTIAVGGLMQLAASPKLPIAFGLARPLGPGQRSPVVPVDLAAGRAGAALVDLPWQKPPGGLPPRRRIGATGLAISPDGQFLFLREGGPTILRLQIGRDGKLTCLDSLSGADGVSSDWYSIAVDADSRYLLACNFGPFVYCVDEMSKPVLTPNDIRRGTPTRLPSGATLRPSPETSLAGGRGDFSAFALDPACKRLCLLTRDGTLQLHGPEGAMEFAWELVPRASDTAYSGMILPHPAGGRLVVRCGGKLFWTQYPATIVSAAKPGGDWVGSADARTLSTARKTAEPVETGQSLAGESVKVKDATITALKPKGDALVDSVIWSADGKFCYLLAIDGTLSKVEMPKLVEQRRVILPNRGRGLTISKAGLVAAGWDRYELFVIDPDSLKILRKIDVPDYVAGLSSSPATNQVLVTCGNNTDPIDDFLVDAATGKILADSPKWQPPGKPAPPGSERGKLPYGLGLARISEDGKYVVRAKGLGRYKLTAAQVVLDEKGPAVGCMEIPNFLSPDSNYVARVNTQPPPPGHIKADYPHAYIYKLTSLAKPVACIQHPKGIQTVAFSPTARRIYVGNAAFPLVSFSPTGDILAEYGPGGDTTAAKVIGTEAGLVRQIAVQPDTGNAIVWTRDRVLWFQLPVGE